MTREILFSKYDDFVKSFIRVSCIILILVIIIFLVPINPVAAIVFTLLVLLLLLTNSKKKVEFTKHKVKFINSRVIKKMNSEKEIYFRNISKIEFSRSKTDYMRRILAMSYTEPPEILIELKDGEEIRVVICAKNDFVKLVADKIAYYVGI